MDHPDYAARARNAEVQADHAHSPGIAKGYRELAETYRALAEQIEHMAPHDQQRWTGDAADERQETAKST